MSAAEIVARDLYFRVTGAEGKTHVEHARVWDADRFMAAQRERGIKQDKPEDRYIVTIATEAEYKAQ